MRYQPVNAWGIPTGRVEQRPAASEVLGDKFIDDGFDEVAPGSVFALSGGDRRIEVHFDEGFTAAQVFAPGDDDVVCFEPMAAPTDALRRGGYREVQPGESAVARFRIHGRLTHPRWLRGCHTTSAVLLARGWARRCSTSAVSSRTRDCSAST